MICTPFSIRRQSPVVAGVPPLLGTSPGVMPTAMRVAGFVFDTIAQYSPKKPRTGLGQFSGEFLLGSLEWGFRPEHVKDR